MKDGTSERYYQTCIAEEAGSLVANKFTNGSKTFKFWTVGTETSGEITAANANTTNTYRDGYSFTSAFENTAKGTVVHLYAYWADNTLGNYWTNTANAADPLAGDTIKTQTEIAANKTTESFWTPLYESDAHLYTYWNGTEADPVIFANRFVEFRIIQVGEHDGDGSAVTFMATHSLPTAQIVNSEFTNAGSWESSEMRNKVFAGSGYVQTGISGLKDAAKAIKKVTTSGSCNEWVESSTTTDSFWILSNTEIFGNKTDDGNTLVPTWFYEEGTQYKWFAQNNVNAKSGQSTTNDALKNMNKTRDGSTNPACIGVDSSDWVLRSPLIYSSTHFGIVQTNGEPANNKANIPYGVVLAFAM